MKYTEIPFIFKYLVKFIQHPERWIDKGDTPGPGPTPSKYQIEAGDRIFSMFWNCGLDLDLNKLDPQHLPPEYTEGFVGTEFDLENMFDWSKAVYVYDESEGRYILNPFGPLDITEHEDEDTIQGMFSLVKIPAGSHIEKSGKSYTTVKDSYGFILGWYGDEEFWKYQRIAMSGMTDLPENFTGGWCISILFLFGLYFLPLMLADNYKRGLIIDQVNDIGKDGHSIQEIVGIVPFERQLIDLPSDPSKRLSIQSLFFDITKTPNFDNLDWTTAYEESDGGLSKLLISDTSEGTPNKAVIAFRYPDTNADSLVLYNTCESFVSVIWANQEYVDKITEKLPSEIVDQLAPQPGWVNLNKYLPLVTWGSCGMQVVTVSDSDQEEWSKWLSKEPFIFNTKLRTYPLEEGSNVLNKQAIYINQFMKEEDIEALRNYVETLDYTSYDTWDTCAGTDYVGHASLLTTNNDKFTVQAVKFGNNGEYGYVVDVKYAYKSSSDKDYSDGKRFALSSFNYGRQGHFDKGKWYTGCDTNTSINTQQSNSFEIDINPEDKATVTHINNSDIWNGILISVDDFSKIEK